MDMTFIDVSTTDPAFNLALEQYVFDRMPRDRGYFMLWRNDNAIIVGRHQNTLAEINEDFVRDRGVWVVRRLSGGGAVYHDLGNLNFTYIVDAAQGPRVDLRLFCQPVAEALRSLGVDARVNGRNDITIDGRKFSGNAQYVREGRVMHHGTIMFDSDLTVLGQALQVSREKIETKGVRSVRSRVTNVRPYLPPEVTMDLFKARILESVSRGRPMERYDLTAEDAVQVEDLRRRRYDTWEWNYGASPACSALRRRRVEGCGRTVPGGLLQRRGAGGPGPPPHWPAARGAGASRRSGGGGRRPLFHGAGYGDASGHSVPWVTKQRQGSAPGPVDRGRSFPPVHRNQLMTTGVI